MWIANSWSSKQRALLAALALLVPLFGLAPTGPIHAQTDETPVIEQSALDGLKRMSEKLASAKSLSVEVRDMRDIPSSPGPMLTFVNTADVTMERPNKLRVDAVNRNIETVLVYDGMKLSILDKPANMFVAIDAPGNLDEVMRLLAQSHGIQLAFEDFLRADPYAVLSKNLENAFEAGEAIIDDVKTRHLVFSAENIEYQLWIDPATDLPRLLSVTYLDAERPTRFLVEFEDWKLDEAPDAKAFQFQPPQDATAIEFIPASQR